ncbi:hypothetical protein [Mycolicibacterium sp.]|uniref:hypothetical protein n=1 Tax=Mycolicibacterium sp. TaxID=2320850 RepID=UPI001A33A582|nr:hypothetical protein [Mycolicibacterium sp.]MBJ7401347.1 hypothetical protein [Mycolicibacterium sp.]
MSGGALMRTAVASGLCIAALAATSAAATADSVTPAPEPVLLAEAPVGAAAPGVPDPFATTSAVTKQNPLSAFADVLAQASPDSVLAPLTAPGAAAAPDPLAAAGMLMPQNYRMPTGELPSPYVLATGVPPGPFARVDGVKGLRAMIHGALGRMPGVELGQPLPGTAPPPGTAIPLGLVQFLPDPAELVPADPAAPLIPLPVPPAG